MPSWVSYLGWVSELQAHRSLGKVGFGAPDLGQRCPFGWFVWLGPPARCQLSHPFLFWGFGFP